MTMRWRGLMAPDDAKTGDRRAFAPGAITHRKLPLPAEWVRVKGAGHSGAVTVAEIDAVYATEEGMWGTGELLDPMIIPDVTAFAYLAGKRLVGPSVDLDPDMTFTWTPDPENPAEAIRLITRGNIHSVTFVSTPAFPQVSVEIYDDEEAGALLASAGIECFAVNGSNWRSWPIAEKNTPWSADASIARLAVWSGGDGKKYRQAFLYYDAKSRPDIKETYRLPIADVVNDKLVLIPRAVYQAAAFLSGAHGGVKDIPDNEVQPLQRVVTEIYAVLAQTQEDPQLVPPWQRGGRQGAEDNGMSIMKEVVVDDRDEQDIDVADEDMALVASAMDRPPKEWFADPKFTGITQLEVTADGRVYGHMADWKTCHKAFRHKCQLAPRSATNYKHYKLGKVLCADGSTVKVGRITVGTGHADDRFGVIPAREHYDNTGTCAAVVNVGEDAYGIWVAGALVAGLSEAKAAELRRSPLSGDWRRVNGNLELVGALAVNDPGFEVISEDEAGVYSLTAAGVLRALEPGADEDCGCTTGEEPRDWSALLAEVDDVIMNADSAAKLAAWEALGE